MKQCGIAINCVEITMDFVDFRMSFSIAIFTIFARAMKYIDVTNPEYNSWHGNRFEFYLHACSQFTPHNKSYEINNI